jgi:hypothetical protein
MYDLDGVLCVVSGTELYTVTNGTATLQGTIAGTGLVGMKTNDREAGPQLVITNGTTTAYVYTISGGLTTTTLTGPAYHVEYQDGYFIYDWNGTGKWFISSVLDGTTYDSTETGATNASPDKVVRIVSNHEQVWVFGDKSYEIYYDSGNLDFPFVRIGEATNEDETIGLGARWSLTEMDNTIYWIGRDREVYKANGYSPVQISDPSISEALRNVDLDQVTAFSYSDGGHKFYQINLDDKSLVFDARENAWHQRGSWINGKWTKHRAATYIRYQDQHLVGDYQTNQIHQIAGHKDFNSTPLRWEMITPPLHNNGSIMFFPNLFVDFQSGVGLGNGTDPTTTLEWSNDARTWSNESRLSMGKIGNYVNRAIKRRLGSTKHQRIFRIAGSDPVETVIMGLGIGA